MGNRAIIVTEDTTHENMHTKIGVYVHWFGDKEQVQHVLDKCKEKHVRSYKDDENYFWARFCQLFADYITEESRSYREDYETGIGIGIVSQLPDAWDNGAYYINDKFEIVKHTKGTEFDPDAKQEPKQLWKVTQTQRSEDFYNATVYLTEDYDEAVKCARMMNKQWGRGCVFTEEGDFEYEVADYDNTHYYDVEGEKTGIDFDYVVFGNNTENWKIEAYKNGEVHCGWLDANNDITQTYDDGKVFDNYAETVKLARELSNDDITYCVCPAD